MSLLLASTAGAQFGGFDDDGQLAGKRIVAVGQLREASSVPISGPITEYLEFSSRTMTRRCIEKTIFLGVTRIGSSAMVLADDAGATYVALFDDRWRVQVKRVRFIPCPAF